MSDIEFEADVQDARGLNHYSDRSGAVGGSNTHSQFVQIGSDSNIGMVKWLISHGIIGGESGAKAILFAIVTINFIAMGLILYFYVLH